MKKTIVIVGLGLIGGSMALALQGFEEYEIVGVDVSQPTLRYAREHHVADRVCAQASEVLPHADLVILALHPKGITEFFSAFRNSFRPGCVVTDVCGVKCAIAEAAAVLPDTVDYIGAHPMAGTEFSGITNAFAEMFQGTHLILTPRPESTEAHVALLTRMAAHMGCKDVYRTTPEAHDRLIAYTSQLMHIIALSVCDDPQFFSCKGFEGSSFRGCTRVAALDVALWTQLLGMNAGALVEVIDHLLDNLTAYRDVLSSGDAALLAEKLTVSSDRKRKLDLTGPDLLA
ncbi:MAG: prephenate dehydrogenase/arogenate dehydrogenase family protein [Oscillospiraceae bacterium]|nr:prephenate dehydrogenase/arogenate dehydrogenase family protein [Oscillospiraceae bacterium]